MDDFAFKYPKIILRWLLIGAMVIAIGWGVITWDSKNAIDLWTKEVTLITKPIFNFYIKRAENRAQVMTDSIIKNNEYQDQ